MGKMIKRGGGSRPTGAPSSQGDKTPTLIRTPNLTRPRDMAQPVNNSGPGYGNKGHQG